MARGKHKGFVVKGASAHASKKGRKHSKKHSRKGGRKRR